LTAREVCPQCGNARTGSFRFCRSCGFDYDRAPRVPAAPAAAAPGTPARVAPSASAARARPRLFTAGGIRWLVVAALNLAGLLLVVTAGGLPELGELGGAVAILMVLLAFAVGRGLLSDPSRRTAIYSALLGVLYLAASVLSFTRQTGADELATLASVIPAVAVILAGVLPLLAVVAAASSTMPTRPRSASCSATSRSWRPGSQPRTGRRSGRPPPAAAQAARTE